MILAPQANFKQNGTKILFWAFFENIWPKNCVFFRAQSPSILSYFVTGICVQNPRKSSEWIPFTFWNMFKDVFLDSNDLQTPNCEPNQCTVWSRSKIRTCFMKKSQFSNFQEKLDGFIANGISRTARLIDSYLKKLRLNNVKGRQNVRCCHRRQKIQILLLWYGFSTTEIKKTLRMAVIKWADCSIAQDSHMKILYFFDSVFYGWV